MDSLTSWLMALIGPLARRVMAALGVGVVTYTGLSEALDAAITTAQTALGGLPAEVALLVARFGFFEYMAITSGGIVSGLLWMQLKRMAVSAGTPS